MQPLRSLRPRLQHLTSQLVQFSATPVRRGIIAAPGPNAGPLMTRRPNRELPSIESYWRWLRTVPLFVTVIGAAMLGIFNYQRSSSSVVNSTHYALRTSDTAREVLGDEIYFAQKIPWISGELEAGRL